MNGWATDVSQALDSRLFFREAFLTAIDFAELRIRPDALKEPWLQMQSAIKKIQETHNLGTAVPAAFNTKMQGILASTMPPRPIVQPSFEEAMNNWSRLCLDGAEAVDILRYEDPQSLLVCLVVLLSAIIKSAAACKTNSYLRTNFRALCSHFRPKSRSRLCTYGRLYKLLYSPRTLCSASTAFDRSWTTTWPLWSCQQT